MGQQSLCKLNWWKNQNFSFEVQILNKLQIAPEIRPLERPTAERCTLALVSVSCSFAVPSSRASSTFVAARVGHSEDCSSSWPMVRRWIQMGRLWVDARRTSYRLVALIRSIRIRNLEIRSPGFGLHLALASWSDSRWKTRNDEEFPV